MTSTEREITEPVDLCLPSGRLNRAAVGWTRGPLHRTAMTGWGRTKRWEYWGVVTDRFCVGIVVSSLDYAGVCSLWVLDRETGLVWQRTPSSGTSDWAAARLACRHATTGGRRGWRG